MRPGAVLVLLATLLASTLASLPHRWPDDDAGSSASSTNTAAKRSITTLAAAAQAGAAHGRKFKARRKANVASLMSTSSEHPATLRARLKKETHAVARMRKAIQKAAPSVAQTAEALRRKGVTVTDTLTNTFISYDTDARRAQLQLPALQGTAEQKTKCKKLGWKLVSLYLDLATGEEVKYNEGCSDYDLWGSGVGYEEVDGSIKCYKAARTPDMDINWNADNPFYPAPCWASKHFTDYCSATPSAKCTLNGTKGTGTGTGTKSWYTTGNAATGGQGEPQLSCGTINVGLVRSSPAMMMMPCVSIYYCRTYYMCPG